MYNRLFKFLTDNQILYNKQFGFQKQHSTEHAIIQLIDQICSSFEENKYTLGIFIDLSKAFDTVNHKILLSKLENYGVRGKNFEWFKSYLTNRNQAAVVFEKKTTNLLQIECGVPQGSILGPLLFLIYVNDLKAVSKILDPIMFADDTNLFYSHRDVKTLFATVNEELTNINEWFMSNKLSLNTSKTHYSFFHKLSKKDDIPLKLPLVYIKDCEIKRNTSVKFLGVMVDENLTWKDHIKTIENKIAKSLGLLYKSQHLIDKISLKSIYFSYIHSYINYANIAWASTHRTKLRKLHNQQKHAVRIVENEKRETPSKPLFKNLNVLNIYQLNIHQTLCFMHKTTMSKTTPLVFHNMFVKPKHKYPTQFRQNNYIIPRCNLKTSRFAISKRAPILWNSVLTNTQKEIIKFSRFRSSSKKLLLSMKNEIEYF